jgi:hypothetical protein
MFGTEFGEKCIIMQFLGAEKNGKTLLTQSSQRRREKILRRIRGGKLCKEPGRPEGGPYAFFR